MVLSAIVYFVVASFFPWPGWAARSGPSLGNFNFFSRPAQCEVAFLLNNFSLMLTHGKKL